MNIPVTHAAESLLQEAAMAFLEKVLWVVEIPFVSRSVTSKRKKHFSACMTATVHRLMVLLVARGNLK